MSLLEALYAHAILSFVGIFIETYVNTWINESRERFIILSLSCMYLDEGPSYAFSKCLPIKHDISIMILLFPRKKIQDRHSLLSIVIIILQDLP